MARQIRSQRARPPRRQPWSAMSAPPNIHLGCRRQTIPPRGVFYTLDPRAIGDALGVHNVAPFTLVALGAPAAPDGPVPADTLPRPPNNHLQYAFTWFGLAGALAAVFVAWVRGR